MHTARSIVSFLVIVGAAGCSRDARRPAAPPPSAGASAAHSPRAAVEQHSADAPIEAAPTVEPVAHVIDPGSTVVQPVREAVAILVPTRGSHATGVVRFREVEGGLDVFAAVDGLAGGPRAYHVHVFGDCTAPDGSSAGPHFHFTGSSFDTHAKMITGNLGELTDDGRLTLSDRRRIESASLDGRFSIIGRSVIVHEKANDPAVTPDGGAGKRLACGVIGIANPAPPTKTAMP